MVRIVNAQDIISMESETHYSFRTQIESTQYPQIHDFFEITLVTGGFMIFKLNQETFSLCGGDLVFVRPGDIHSKKQTVPCQHINLAFPAKTIEALFSYVYGDEDKEHLLSMPFVPVIHLPHNEMALLQSRLERLRLFSLSEKTETRNYLRVQLILIFSQHILPVRQKSICMKSELSIPIWLENSLMELKDINNLAIGMDFLTESTNKTKEHICRVFRKFLHTTPTAYINARRLDYIANMLLHSDNEIIELAYEVGFQSISNFYALFKREYGVTPMKFRQNMGMAQPESGPCCNYRS